MASMAIQKELTEYAFECVYLSLYIYIFIRIDTHTHSLSLAYTCLHIDEYIYVQIYKHICTTMDRYKHWCIIAYTYMYTCIYIYIYVCIHSSPDAVAALLPQATTPPLKGQTRPFAEAPPGRLPSLPGLRGPEALEEPGRDALQVRRDVLPAGQQVVGLVLGLEALLGRRPAWMCICIYTNTYVSVHMNLYTGLHPYMHACQQRPGFDRQVSTLHLREGHAGDLLAPDCIPADGHDHGPC